MPPLARPAAVAGLFYPATAAVLAESVDKQLAQARVEGKAVLPSPKAIIVPHAGYIYSGAIAASVYALLESVRATVRRVILLGPAHRMPVRGLALPSCDAFATPLGAVTVDRAALAAAPRPPVVVSDEAHAQEHSLEVQLPFLQRVLANFKLLPFVVGQTSPEEVAKVLESFWGGEESLIVISSDLSHYQPGAQARMADAATAERILGLDPTVRHEEACGATPINGLLLAARRRGMTVRLLDLRHSGDTAGDEARVVGYGAFAFYEPPDAQTRPTDEHALDDSLGQTLLGIARNAIARQLDVAEHALPAPRHARLAQAAASFVTLTYEARLRGCIGRLEASRPLAEDVAENACAAAFHDPRFPPLSHAEWPAVRIEVSLLTPPEPLPFTDEADALARLRPGIDGLILTHGRHRATFLPQVWESLPEPRRFMAELKRKAGLAADFWDEEITLARYRVQKWQETP